MTVIFKYVLLSPNPVIAMPRYAGFLTAGVQDGNIVVWAEVDENEPQVMRRLSAVNTGTPRPLDGIYIGTVSVESIVWHVYDRGEIAGEKPS